MRMKDNTPKEEQLNDVRFEQTISEINNQGVISFKNCNIKDTVASAIKPVYFVPVPGENKSNIFTSCNEPYYAVCDQIRMDMLHNCKNIDMSKEDMFNSFCGYFNSKFSDYMNTNASIIIENGLNKCIRENFGMNPGETFKNMRYNCGLLVNNFYIFNTRKVKSFDAKRDLFNFVTNIRQIVAERYTQNMYEYIMNVLSLRTPEEELRMNKFILEASGIDCSTKEAYDHIKEGAYSLVVQYLLELATEDINKIVEMAVYYATTLLAQLISIQTVISRRTDLKNVIRRRSDDWEDDDDYPFEF